MDEQLKRFLYMGIGLASLSKRARFLLDKLEIEGQLGEEEGKRIVEDILKEVKGEGAHLKDDFYRYLHDTLNEFETPSRKDLNELKQRVEKLEALMRAMGHDL